MRQLVIAALALGTATGALAQAPLPAESNVRIALDRIARVDPQLHSVLAVDPTAIEQARRVDASNLRGPLAGQPVLIKDNIEAAGPLPTTAGSLALANNVTNRDAPLVTRLRAAGAIILGKTNLIRMGQHPLQQLDLGLERGRRTDSQSLGARSQRLRKLQRVGRGGRRRPGPLCHRHRDRRVGHLPSGAKRDRRFEADRRTGQPNAHRSDQP